MDKDDQIIPVEVFTGAPWQAEMVKNLLENEGIEAFLKDEIIGTRSPWLGSTGVKVVVIKQDFNKAKLIVEEYERNFRENK